MSNINPICCRYLLTGILSVHALLLGYSAWWMSPTLDEPAHVAAGLSHWQQGDFSLYRVNPPLVRLVATVPALVMGHKYQFPKELNTEFSRLEFQIGEEFVTQNGRWTLWLVTLGRWACIPFSIIGGLVCYCWARDLFGSHAGFLACTLWCFSPMVLGHASLLTPDAPSAALGALACYTFWKWLREPSWGRTISSGLLLGIAELSKTTLILFYPLWPVLWLIYRLPERASISLAQWRREIGMLVARMLIGLYVINLGYLGYGSFVQLKEYHFRSELFGARTKEVETTGNRFRESVIGYVPVPLPLDFVLGIDHQQRDFEKFWGPSYLRGTYQETGWWYYYFYALGVKTPIGTMVLGFLVIVCRCLRLLRRVPWRDEFIVVFPMLFLFVVVSSKWGFSHHLRYLFPCFPFAFVWISQIATLFERVQSNALTTRNVSEGHSAGVVIGPTRTVFATLASMSWIATMSSSMYHYPNGLAYFNEIAGGPRNGGEHLLNSNIDWGQDLLQLESWIQKNRISEDVYLAFDNYYNPFVLKIHNIVPWPIEADTREKQLVTGTSESTNVQPGLYAISVNQLYEFPWSLRDEQGRRYRIDKRPLQHLRRMRPIGWAGYSIRIYDSEQLRRAYQSASDDVK